MSPRFDSPRLCPLLHKPTSPFPPSPTSSLQNPTPKSLPRRPHFHHYYTQYWSKTCHFSSNREDDDDEMGGSSEEDELELVKRVLSGEEKGRGGGNWLQIGGPTRTLRSGFQAVWPGFFCRSGSSFSSFGVVFHWMFMGVLIFCYLFVFRLDRTCSR